MNKRGIEILIINWFLIVVEYLIWSLTIKQFQWVWKYYSLYIFSKYFEYSLNFLTVIPVFVTYVMPMKMLVKVKLGLFSKTLVCWKRHQSFIIQNLLIVNSYVLKFFELLVVSWQFDKRRIWLCWTRWSPWTIVPCLDGPNASFPSDGWCNKALCFAKWLWPKGSVPPQPESLARLELRRDAESHSTFCTVRPIRPAVTST